MCESEYARERECKGNGVVWILNNRVLAFVKVPDEKFLVLVNDLLASGEIPDLLPEDDIENIIAGMRSECKAAGMEDTRENCWAFFINKIRRQLKVLSHNFSNRLINSF